MPQLISPLSQVHPSAKLGSDVEIGPFCVVGPDVSIGKGTKLDSHVSIFGQVTDGMEVVDAIAAAATGAQDRPVAPVTITGVDVRSMVAMFLRSVGVSELGPVMGMCERAWEKSTPLDAIESIFGLLTSAP